MMRCLQVFCIREAATQNLQKLASEFGPDWAKDNLVPQVRLRTFVECSWSYAHGHTIPEDIDERTPNKIRFVSGGLQVLAMVSNAHYLHRMTVLGALAALAPAVGHDTLCNTMLPVVLSCAKDKVCLVSTGALFSNCLQARVACIMSGLAHV